MGLMFLLARPVHEGPRDQDALSLPGRERGHALADQSVHAHRQRVDIVLQARERGSLPRVLERELLGIPRLSPG